MADEHTPYYRALALMNAYWRLWWPNDIRGLCGPKVLWHLSYRRGKTPKKPSPGNLSRPGIEPGPAAWQARIELIRCLVFFTSSITTCRIRGNPQVKFHGNPPKICFFVFVINNFRHCSFIFLNNFLYSGHKNRHHAII